MLPKGLENLVRDLKSGKDIATRLKRVLGPSTKAVSRAQQLELVTRVLEQVSSAPSEAVNETFEVAICALRAFAPVLKAASAIEAIAGVEKFAVNYAFHSYAPERKSSSLPHAEVLRDTLRLIMSARQESSKSGVASRRAPRIRNTSASKENLDPQLEATGDDLPNDESLDLLLYTEASCAGMESFLPKRDSAAVAVTVTGALAIRLTQIQLNDLRQLFVLSARLVVPWINYLCTFTDACSQRTSTAYASLVSNFLFEVCRSAKADPCSVLRIRLCALKLRDYNLKRFAWELLHSANRLTRDKGLGKGPNCVMEVVTTVYEDAIAYVARFDASDPRWTSEDVSAWMDNIVTVWSRQRPLRPLPAAFASRISVLRKKSSAALLLECYKLQVDLYNSEAYCGDVAVSRAKSAVLFSPALWKRVGRLLDDISVQDVLTYEVRDQLRSSAEEYTRWEVSEADGVRCLRLLRLLEPLRRTIMTASQKGAALPQGAEKLLRTYLSALLRGINVTSCTTTNGKPVAEDALREVLIRLQKMVGGGTEAAACLIQQYIHQRQTASLCDVMGYLPHLLRAHEDFSCESSEQWRDWVFSQTVSCFQKTISAARRQRGQKSDTSLKGLAEGALQCAKLLTVRSHDHSYTAVCMRLLHLARDTFALLHMLQRTAEVSLISFGLLHHSNSQQRKTESIVDDNARTLALDMARAALRGESLSFLDDVNVPGQVLLQVLLEYSCWVKQSFSSFKSLTAYVDTLHGVQLARQAVFKFCDSLPCECPTRKTHLAWLTFLSEPDSDFDVLMTKADCDGLDYHCRGHKGLGLFQLEHDDCECSDSHLAIVKVLSRACSAFFAKELSVVSELLLKGAPLFQAEAVCRCAELMVICSEILEWFSVALAMTSYNELAALAKKLAIECWPNFETLEKSSTGGMVCDRLDTLRTIDIDVFKTTDKETVYSFKEDYHASPDIVDALIDATEEVKYAVRTLLTSENGPARCSHVPRSLFGTTVDIGFNVRHDSGRLRYIYVLDLIKSLFYIARLQYAVEDTADAKRYMEWCHVVASASFPPTSSYRRTIAARFCTTSPSMKNSPSESLDAMLNIASGDEKDDGPTGDVSSEFCVIMAVVNSALNLIADLSESSLDERFLADILSTLKRGQRMFSDMKKMEMYPATEHVELLTKLHEGVVHLRKGDLLNSLRCMQLAMEGNIRSGEEVKVAAMYHMAQVLIAQGGGLQVCLQLDERREIAKSTRQRRRTTRRTARRMRTEPEGLPEEPFSAARTMLHEATCELPGNVYNLRLCRRLWRLSSMLEHGTEVVVSKLSNSVGPSFDRRLEYEFRAKGIRRAKASKRTERRNEVDDLEEEFNSMTIASPFLPDTRFSGHELRRCLARARSVVVGIMFDESTSNLVLWRICSLGFCFKRIPIPSTGPTSYHGVLESIDSVLGELKNTSVKEDQVLTKQEKRNWWEERTRLDKQMELILSGIQESWLGELSLLLLPSLPENAEVVTEAEEESGIASFLDLSRSLVRDANVSKCQSGKDRDGSTSRTCHATMGHLVLLLDTAVERIPWESIPLLRKHNASATRVPSLAYLTRTLLPESAVNGNSLFYVVNPDGNLSRTEERFRELLGSQQGWVGVTGRTTAELVESQYSEEDIYLYCGHGNGGAHFHPSRRSKLSSAPVALLMGCSSARPRIDLFGDFESNGTAIDFLLQGSPAVVGNLWDVSDGEIDRLTTSVLSLWLGVGPDRSGNKRMSLAEAVTQSRLACHLPYLVGAACVVLGTPNIYAT